MSIDLRSLTPRETIVVNTHASVYELTVLQPDDGDMLVRGGSHFTELRRVRFLGSSGDARLYPQTIDIGLRMQFICGNRLITTSPVQSFSRRPTSTASSECAAGR